MKKAAIRTRFLAERRALSAEEVNRRSAAVAERFFDPAFSDQLINRGHEFLAPYSTVHTFLPIARQNEVDTWPIIHRLWHERWPVRVAVSVTDPITNRLSHFLLTPTTLLTENAWGIPEPAPTAHPLRPVDFDIVLVPLLAFDQRGHRVGYGKGFYDRFLAECRPDCLKIGLSLVEPIACIDDVELTDIRLDMCIAPTKIWFF